jgi:DNA polymerase-3 subunit gamma/tau
VVKKYAELKNQNKQFQAATMLSGQLVKYNEPVITILLNNEAQLHTYNDIKQEFLDYVRTELKNNLIQIEVDEHKDQVVKKALTPLEKFNLMAAKNPLLTEFRKRLDLDPTF